MIDTNIKLPACYDISHYKEVPDFKLVAPRPLIFITKATEAYPGTPFNTTDSKFIRFASGMMEIEVIRGFYHFYRKVSSTEQARHFVNTINKIEVLVNDLLILDVEEGGVLNISNLWAWFEFVHIQFPRNQLLLYSRKNILDVIPMTDAEKAYFRKIPVWTAGYPTFPNNYNYPPMSYIPNQNKFGPVYLWQYAIIPHVNGIVGDVDLNWIDPVFASRLGNNKVENFIMANYEGTCENSDTKVWKEVGGERVYPDVKRGDKIRADSKKTVGGIEYLHLTSPTLGWSKAVWFVYHDAGTGTPTEPPPVPVPTKKAFSLKIDGFKEYSGELDPE